MEKKRSIRERAKAGEVCYGMYVAMYDPMVIEIAAKAGYDFVRIDLEHTYMSPNEMRQMLTVARLIGIPCQVRIPDFANLNALLGQEPAGIMVPHCNTVEYAQEAVSLTKFAPLGERGMDSSTRYMRCGGMKRPEYMKYASENQDLIVQIESKEALDNMDKILAVPGIDMVATGRQDLSQSLGLAGQSSHPDVIAAEDAIIKKALELGLIPTITVEKMERMKQLYDWGVRVFLVGKDEMALEKGLKNSLKELTLEV